MACFRVYVYKLADVHVIRLLFCLRFGFEHRLTRDSGCAGYSSPRLVLCRGKHRASAEPLRVCVCGANQPAIDLFGHVRLATRYIQTKIQPEYFVRCAEPCILRVVFAIPWWPHVYFESVFRPTDRPLMSILDICDILIAGHRENAGVRAAAPAAHERARLGGLRHRHGEGRQPARGFRGPKSVVRLWDRTGRGWCKLD